MQSQIGFTCSALAWINGFGQHPKICWIKLVVSFLFLETYGKIRVQIQKLMVMLALALMIHSNPAVQSNLQSLRHVGGFFRCPKGWYKIISI